MTNNDLAIFFSVFEKKSWRTKLTKVEKQSCGKVGRKNISDQMSEGSQVSKVTLCFQILKWQSVSECRQ